MKETETYLIPAPVTARWEIIPGVGGRELVLGAIAAGLGLGIAALLKKAGAPLAIVAGLAVLPPAAVLVGSRPGPDGVTVWALARAVLRWRGGQKAFQQAGGGWWM